MKSYLISYDLIRPETSLEYTKLFEKIRSYTHWAKPLRSVWLIKTDKTTLDVIKDIMSVTDHNDKIIVIEITNAWHTLNISKEVTNWMKRNL